MFSMELNNRTKLLYFKNESRLKLKFLIIVQKNITRQRRPKPMFMYAYSCKAITNR